MRLKMCVLAVFVCASASLLGADAVSTAAPVAVAVPVVQPAAAAVSLATSPSVAITDSPAAVATPASTVPAAPTLSPVATPASSASVATTSTPVVDAQAATADRYKKAENLAAQLVEQLKSKLQVISSAQAQVQQAATQVPTQKP